MLLWETKAGLQESSTQRGSLWPAARGQWSLSSPSFPKEPLWTPVLWPCTSSSTGLTRPRGLLASPGWEDSGARGEEAGGSAQLTGRWIWPGLGRMASAGLWAVALTSHMGIPWASWSHAVDPWVSRLEKLLMDRSPGSTRRCLGGCV